MQVVQCCTRPSLTGTSAATASAKHSHLGERSHCLSKRNSAVTTPSRRSSHHLRQQFLSSARLRGPRNFQRGAALLELAAVLPGICFDSQCQDAADTAFLIVTAIPLLGLLIAIILRYRPLSPEQLDQLKVAMHATSIFAWWKVL